MHTSLVAPYAAHLRVYEPLSVFPERQRVAWARRWAQQWAGRAEERGARDAAVRVAAAVAERRAALANVLPTPPVAAPERESEDAFVLVVDGATYACPWQARLRSWEALAAFPAPGLAPALSDAFLPRVVLEQARADHERWRRDHPEERPHIRTSTWQVPLGWFVLFDDADRSLRLARPRSLVYRSTMGSARRRTARALRTLRRAQGVPGDDLLEAVLSEAGPVERGLVEGIEDVGRWLEEFHPRSVVELDYAGLVHLLDDSGLEEDHSAADVSNALEALRTGDPAAAGTCLAQLAGRWSAVRALEHAN